MSKRHLKLSFIFMYLQFREEAVLDEQYQEYKTSQDNLESYYNTGDFYKRDDDDNGRNDELDDEDMRLFADIDIDDFDNDIKEDTEDGG